MVSENLIRQIQTLGSQQAKLQVQVATGQRIFQPEDDPSAMGRILNLESEQRVTTQFNKNAERALEISQASFSGLREIKKVSDRATEIGTLGMGTNGAAAANAYASELDQLIEHTVQLGNAKLRNDFLFAGTAVDAAPFVPTRNAAGAITSVAYAGNANRTPIALSENATIKPGTTNSTNAGLATFVNQLVALRDALNSGNASALSTAQAGLMTSENLIVSSLAEQGGVQTRIEANQTQLQSRADSLESLVSSEADLDLPTSIVKLTQSQTSYEAALASAAKIMSVSLMDFIH